MPPIGIAIASLTTMWDVASSLLTHKESNRVKIGKLGMSLISLGAAITAFIATPLVLATAIISGSVNVIRNFVDGVLVHHEYKEAQKKLKALEQNPLINQTVLNKQRQETANLKIDRRDKFVEFGANVLALLVFICLLIPGAQPAGIVLLGASVASGITNASVNLLERRSVAKRFNSAATQPQKAALADEKPLSFETNATTHNLIIKKLLAAFSQNIASSKLATDAKPEPRNLAQTVLPPAKTKKFSPTQISDQKATTKKCEEKDAKAGEDKLAIIPTVHR